MNYAADDIHRSVRRYIATALGNTWRIRGEREVIKDDERPAAVVEFSTPVGQGPGHRDRRTIPQGDVSRAATFAVTAYPALFDTAREGRHEADRIADLLDQTIGQGLVDDDSGELVNIGHPLAVPVYDYAGVPLTGAGRGGPADPYGWAMVETHSVHPIQDPLDEKRWTVAMSLRLSWWRAGREAMPAERWQRIMGTPDVH